MLRYTAYDILAASEHYRRIRFEFHQNSWREVTDPAIMLNLTFNDSPTPHSVVPVLPHDAELLGDLRHLSQPSTALYLTKIELVEDYAPDRARGTSIFRYLDWTAFNKAVVSLFHLKRIALYFTLQDNAKNFVEDDGADKMKPLADTRKLLIGWPGMYTLDKVSMSYHDAVRLFSESNNSKKRATKYDYFNS